ncbi:hypothetical protein GX586_07735 [bacterium]|nr:hypothetical protein [bacterium]
MDSECELSDAAGRQRPLPYHQGVSFPPAYIQASTHVLETALRSVAAYASWRPHDPGPACDIDTRYAALPSLTKKDIRAHFPAGLLLPGKDLEKGLASGAIWFVETSGTTADQVTNIWCQEWWDASERASWGLNSEISRIATGGHPEAILVSPLNVGIVGRNGLLPMHERIADQYLFLNEVMYPSEWTDALLDRMVSELNSFQPVVLEGNPSLLAILARHIVRRGARVHPPGAIVLTYEFPSRIHVRQIRMAFPGVPLASSYGSTEAGYVFMECEHGRLHQNAEYCRVDFQPFKEEHGGPAVGRVLLTVLNHPWCSLVRFDVGDLARLDARGACPCGRGGGMVLEGIEGRAVNVTLAPDGRALTQARVDDALAAVDVIDEYRLEQRAGAEYELMFAAGADAPRDVEGAAAAVLHALYGPDARIAVRRVGQVPPEASGKYRLARAAFPVTPGYLLDARYALL